MTDVQLIIVIVSSAVASVLALCAIWGTFYIVPQRKVALITRFGRHVRTLSEPGLKLKIPFIEKVEAKVSTAERQVDETLETKTNDDLFVALPISIHYEVHDSYVYWFDKEDAVKLMKKVVAAAVREYTSAKSFQDLYNERHEIKLSVLEKVEAQIKGYGITITDIVIDEPQASDAVKKSFDNVRASALLAEAAENEAQAAYIKMVKAAKADRVRNAEIGEGVADFRRAIAISYIELRDKLKKAGVDESLADQFMQEAMKLDTLRDIGDKGNLVIHTESNPNANGTEKMSMGDLIAMLKSLGIDIPKKTSKKVKKA